jgi:predicted  nucleic acid-binding Zn-ribbon protein
MSFADKLPVHRAELEGRIEELRAQQEAMQTKKLADLHEELEDAENEVTRIEEEIDDELTSIQESEEWVALDKAAADAEDELKRLNTYAGSIFKPKSKA